MEEQTLKRAREEIYRAIDQGGKEEVANWLDNGYPIESQNELGETILHQAVKCGQPDIVEMLVVAYRANIFAKTINNQTPLDYAANSRITNREKVFRIILKVLLESGRHIDEQDDSGSTLLHHAVEFGDEEIIRMLVLEHHANLEIKNKRGRTPLDYAVVSYGWLPNPKGVIRTLVRLGANRDAEISELAEEFHLEHAFDDEDDPVDEE